MMRRTVTALVVAALLPASAAAQEQDVGRELPTSVVRTLEKRGFAVDADSEARLVGTYRFPGPDAVYVSSDAGLALYLLLLRRALDEVAFEGDAALVEDALAWDVAVRTSSPKGEAGRVARFFTGVVSAIVEARVSGEDDDASAAVAVQMARVRGTAATAGRVELLDTPFDDERLASLISQPLPEHARWDAAVFWITRVRLPATPAGDAARQVLADALPERLRERATRQFAWTGRTGLRFPGERGVFDVSVRDDLRFPPGTLPDRAGDVGLDLGLRLGSPTAERLRSAGTWSPPDDPVVPPEPGTVAAQFEALLARTLRVPDERAPPLFRSPGWEALALQSALGADAVLRHVLGPLDEPMRVFGGDSPELLVHPDPGFWTELAGLAAHTADEVAASGAGAALPPRASVLAALDDLERCLEEWTSIPDAQRLVLRRSRIDGWTLGVLARVGTGSVPEAEREAIRELLFHSATSLRDEASDVDAWARLATRLTERRGAPAMLRRLAGLAERLSEAADNQPAGQESPSLIEIARSFGSLCEDAEGGGSSADPHEVAAVVLVDPPRVLVHGTSGLHDLWVLYPWHGLPVRARGVVLGFRAWVGEERPTDDRWRELVRSGAARSPSWASDATTPVPADER